jgi:hypothetical protein
MAFSPERTLKAIEGARGDVADVLGSSIAALRKDLAGLTRSFGSYGGHRLDDLQHGASDLARELQHQAPIVAREVGRYASTAGRAVRNDPLPAIVALGTAGLLYSLVFGRRGR